MSRGGSGIGAEVCFAVCEAFARGAIVSGGVAGAAALMPAIGRETAWGGAIRRSRIAGSEFTGTKLGGTCSSTLAASRRISRVIAAAAT